MDAALFRILVSTVLGLTASLFITDICHQCQLSCIYQTRMLHAVEKQVLRILLRPASSCKWKYRVLTMYGDVMTQVTHTGFLGFLASDEAVGC